MEKTVTKEEVERVLEREFGQAYPKSKDRILNELWPPEFKVGDWVKVTYIHSCEAKILDGKTVKLKNLNLDEKWVTTGTESGMHLYEVRHATPEEIAAAEWEPNKPYKVFWSGSWRLYVSAERVGNFYQGSRFEGDSIAISKYEKL